MENEMELEIFRTGDYGPKGAWSEEAIDRMAKDYAADVHEAPVTLDHAQSGPALGWVAGLTRRGDRLVARLKGMSERLVELVRRGAFKKRSVEIYSRLPETGRPYVKAVSFLGAGSPEVKGLRDVLFGEDEGEREIFRQSQGEADRFEFDESNPAEAARAEREEGREISNSDHATAPSVAFSELESKLRRSGRWIPSWEDLGIGRFVEALNRMDDVEIEGGESIRPAAWFAEFLRTLPVYVPVGEAAPGPTRDRRDALPQGDRVNPASIELHRRVVAYCENHPGIDYAEALRECARF
jgi:hypothetical protein